MLQCAGVEWGGRLGCGSGWAACWVGSVPSGVTTWAETAVGTRAHLKEGLFGSQKGGRAGPRAAHRGLRAGRGLGMALPTLGTQPFFLPESPLSLSLQF